MRGVGRQMEAFKEGFNSVYPLSSLQGLICPGEVRGEVGEGGRGGEGGGGGEGGRGGRWGERREEEGGGMYEKREVEWVRRSGGRDEWGKEEQTSLGRQRGSKLDR